MNIDELRLLGRSIFIIDQQGVIRYIDVVEQVTGHPNYQEALDVIKELI